jgi:hypothetical protein
MASIGTSRWTRLSKQTSRVQLVFHLVFLRIVRRLLVRASVVPSSPILVTLIKEALSSSKMSVLIRATQNNIPEDVTLPSYRRENLKSYIPRNLFSGPSIKTSIQKYLKNSVLTSHKPLCSSVTKLNRAMPLKKDVTADKKNRMNCTRVIGRNVSVPCAKLSDSLSQ